MEPVLRKTSGLSRLVTNNHGVAQEVTPSHPNFDRSKLSPEQYIEHLIFENRELQATIDRQDIWIDALSSQLRAHDIMPAVLKALRQRVMSKTLAKKPRSPQPLPLPLPPPLLHRESLILPPPLPSPPPTASRLQNPNLKTTNVGTLEPQLGLSHSEHGGLAPTRSLSLTLPTISSVPPKPMDLKRKPPGSKTHLLDPKGGVHLSPRLASAAAAAAALVKSGDTNSLLPSPAPTIESSDQDVPERSSRRRRELVRIEHPSPRFQEKEEREREEAETLALQKQEQDRKLQQQREEEMEAKHRELQRERAEEEARQLELRLRQLEQTRVDKERAEHERLAREHLERERLENERLAQLESEHHAAEVENERRDKERTQNEQSDVPRREIHERLAKERLAQEMLESHQRERAVLETISKQPELLHNASNTQDTGDGHNRTSVYSDELMIDPKTPGSDMQPQRAEVGSNVEHHHSNGNLQMYKSRLRLPDTLIQQPQVSPQLSSQLRLQFSTPQIPSRPPVVQRSSTHELVPLSSCETKGPSADSLDQTGLKPAIVVPLQSIGDSTPVDPTTPVFGKIPNTPEAFQEYGFGLRLAETNMSAGDTDTKSYMTSPQASAYQQLHLSPTKSDYSSFNNDMLLKTPSNQNYHSVDSLPSYSQIPQHENQRGNQSFQVLQTPKTEDDTVLFVKPEDFQTISIYVLSTIYLNLNRKSDEPMVTLSISDRETGKEMWRIRKSMSQLIAFDNEIRPIVEFFGLPQIPDKSLFLSSSPIKVDARRNQLQNYFNTLFLMPHIPQMVLYRMCRYLSLDFLNPLDDFKSGARKEGYLIRRYKGLGTSWKIRWCQVDGPTLEVYEAPGEPLLEQIRLKGSQIGRQSADSVAEEKGYRHAFLLMEGQKLSKLSNSLPKHFFCAENDKERDEWIECLVAYNGSSDDTFASTNLSEVDLDNTVILNQGGLMHLSNLLPLHKNRDRSTSSVDSSGGMHSHAWSGTTVNDKEDVNENAAAVAAAAASAAAAKKLKKRSMFPFRSKGAANEMGSTAVSEPATLPYLTPIKQESSMQHYLDLMDLDSEVSKSVFGRDIAEAFNLSNQNYYGRQIPTVCCRCLDFLTKTGAVFEEGIFRLSGSASSIRQLKDKFNTYFDVDLFASPLQPDIHTVAGLFKTYLRELPAPILGVDAFNGLKAIVSTVPPNDKALLALRFRDFLNDRTNIDLIHFDICFVIFRFLGQIIANSASNRMNLRNVCIVFVPTLNIPLEILSALLVDFDCIFEHGQPVPNDRREVLDLYIPNF